MPRLERQVKRTELTCLSLNTFFFFLEKKKLVSCFRCLLLRLFVLVDDSSRLLHAGGNGEIMRHTVSSRMRSRVKLMKRDAEKQGLLCRFMMIFFFFVRSD